MNSFFKEWKWNLLIVIMQIICRAWLKQQETKGLYKLYTFRKDYHRFLLEKIDFRALLRCWKETKLQMFDRCVSVATIQKVPLHKSVVSFIPHIHETVWGRTESY